MARRGPLETLWAYRRRLLAAAAASLALHVLLARGLAVTHLGLEGNQAADTAAAKILKPKRRSDYRLEVPASPRADRPAHERPLDVKLAPPQAAPRIVTRPNPADRRVATRRAAEVPPLKPFTRPEAAAQPLESAAGLDRATATATRERVDTSVVGAAPPGDAPAQPSPAAAPLAAMERARAAVVAAPRPREVALLERLAAASTPPRPVEAAAPLAVAAAAPARPSTTVSRLATEVAPAALPPAAASPALTAAPAAQPLNRPLPARIVELPTISRSPAAATAGAADVAGESTISRDRSDAAPLTTPAGGGLGRSAAANPAAIDASAAMLSPQLAAAAGTAATGAPNANVANTGITNSSLAAAGLAPAAVGRTAGGRGLPRDDASGVTAGGAAAAGEDGEELSVIEDREATVPAALGPATVPLDRVAAMSLPAEGRVRDVAEAFARRAPDKRADRRAGSPGDEAAATAARADAVVQRGLDFLSRSQQADGRWSLARFAGGTPADVPKLESETAATGLALLSFLGAGHDHFDGPYQDTVRRGLEFLIAAQKPDGDLYVPADELSNSCSWLYSHGIAAMAVCEAVGMTGDARVKPAAEKACRFIAASQHPDRGGWRYTPASDADLSVSGWMLVALRAGSLAGIDTDPKTLSGVRRLLDAANPPTDPARYLYNPRNPQQRPSRLSSACMTAVGTLMRLHTGWEPTDPRVTASARTLAAIPASYGSTIDKTRDAYLWYYASQVLVHTGGPDWNRWYGGLVDTLTTTQETAGPKAGSWNPLGPEPDRWGQYGGRIYVTALHLLALEVPYRHLPTYTAGRK